ncbi:hypothetical protein J5Y03_14635 [Bacillus sp. RG28]|uniref:Uncharacterized protein n=1 Tax=Gottfriedia endophytica TaxID=2820819 RepID=A0A940NPI7_9BACI|nr:hypothetical protein [Gottfriedia endophytica]MBP0726396.1 hypothetical protein [Gottfriedia endophytica]
MKTLDMNIDNQLKQILNLITTLKTPEIDLYKKGLLERIEQNVRATKCLIENSFLLDSCALIRTTVEHACRLYQYIKDPESISVGRNKSAFQMLGRGPGTTYTFKALGSQGDLGLIYGILCAFVHPDIMSLILSLTKDDKNNMLLKVVTSMGILSSTLILLECYPESRSEEMEKEIINEAESIMGIFQSAIIAFSTPENILGMTQIPGICQLFANKEINQNVQEFIKIANTDPRMIEIVLKELLRI